MPGQLAWAVTASAILHFAAPVAEGKLDGRRNNLVSDVLEVSAIAAGEKSFEFVRSSPGWIFVAARCVGQGVVQIDIDDQRVVDWSTGDASPVEAVRLINAGKRRLRVRIDGSASVDRLEVRAIPELIHCGLGFESAIKSYGRYDIEFLKKDVLPNITTTVVPHNIQLAESFVAAWHRQGKRLIAEVGIDSRAKSAEDHRSFWASFLEKAPFLDGIIINEFIVNAPMEGKLSPERQQRLIRQRQLHRVYEDAIRLFRSDGRTRHKSLYAYVGGSGKKLNQEVIGPTFVRALIDMDCRIALERYLFEVSSEAKAREALRTFVDGVADWEARQPGAKRHMIVTFGLFSMPPGGINKQPNVDYHVWMDQQMQVLANDPAFAGIAGIEWWTSILADEETVRFVGKLYRHYGIEGLTTLLTRDPLFLSHVQNADFQNGVEGWTLQAAEPDSIQPKSFPRYGRIEGRYMGLGRPADPEHIGDTFLWMKRSGKGPNRFSQTIVNLEPGRLYSMKMFTCDYRDLIHPQQKKQGEATPFIGQVAINGVDIDTKRSFMEMYASSPEPPIPVWITYHWTVFRARERTAKLTISDWPASPPGKAQPAFGQEQTFNFLEIQPYHE